MVFDSIFRHMGQGVANDMGHMMIGESVEDSPTLTIAADQVGIAQQP